MSMFPSARLGFAAFLATASLSLSAQADLPYGLTQRVSVKAFLTGKMPPLGPGVSGNWKTVPAFPNLPFKNALGLCTLPGSSRLVVWEREGRVWSFENKADVTDKKLILDVSDRCQGWDDSGLLGIAFHPQFQQNHFVFVSYTWVQPGTVVGNPNVRPPVDKANRDRLARFTLDANGVAIPGSELVLIDQEARTVWHNGGGMFFHPKNGFLYVTDGDDENDDAQIIDRNLFGGIWRLDVDQRGGAISHPIPRQPQKGKTANYFIPNDNPFVGKPNALEEFYAIGLRSPHRMTFDAPSGRIFIGDVGAGEREEIDVIEPSDPAGLNFQWPRVEGLKGDLVPPFIGVNKRPVIDYNHGEGNAVIGGCVYRGKKWADDLGGRYIFGDNGTGKIWVLDETTSPASKIQLATLPNGPGPNTGSSYVGLSSFGFDQDGEIYLCQMSSEAGHIFRLERSGPPPVRMPMPKLLSQTGAFADTAKLIPSPGLIAYNVNSPLWSDGAVKTRWMALPENGKIGFAEKGEWKFPEGTVFIKHFELPMDERRPAQRRRLETRLLVRDVNGSAYGVTYKWRADNSDADLLPDALNEDLTITNSDGTTRKQQWSYPSQTDCMRCHTPAAGYVLGPKTRQLNGDAFYPEANVHDNQLRAWNHLDLFDHALDEAKLGSLDKMVAISDSGASPEQRVRSYLDANCAHCHRPGGVHALWDGRYDTPLAATGIVNGPVITKLATIGAKVVAPGDAGRSLMHRRITSTDVSIKMPPLARNRFDDSAVDAITRWIASLPPAASTLPKPWAADDIGQVEKPGDATFSGGTFTVFGGGADIWDGGDAFHFVSQPLHGDGQIIAHVTSVDKTDDWAKAAVMIRESSSANARDAFVLLTPTQGTAFQRRVEENGGCAHDPGPNYNGATWLRLERKGNVFTGSVSADGRAWTKIREATIAMQSDTVIGLAVTAHNNGALCKATFEQVSVQAASKP